GPARRRSASRRAVSIPNRGRSSSCRLPFCVPSPNALDVLGPTAGPAGSPGTPPPEGPPAEPARLRRVSARNGSNLHLRIRLPMPLRPPIVGTALELHDLDLLRPALTDHLRLDLAAGHERRADAHVLPLADEQDLVEIDGIADLGGQALNAQLVALTYAVLLTARTKNRIHWESSSATDATADRKERDAADRRKRRILVIGRIRVNAATSPRVLRRIRGGAADAAPQGIGLLLAKERHIRHHSANACCPEPTIGAVARRAEITRRRRLERGQRRHLSPPRQRRRPRQPSRSSHHPQRREAPASARGAARRARVRLSR